jgi:hypothetical protein
MQETRGTWADVQVHSYIRDRNGKTWRVAKLSAERARLVDRESLEVDIVRPPGNREVSILTPTDGEAKHTLAAALGARILASKDEEGQYFCPPSSTWDSAAARWHLETFHHIICGEEVPLSRLHELHDADTEPSRPHTHTEEA